MSAVGKRLHPAGISKFPTARKKLRSSVCDHSSSLSLTPSCLPSSSSSPQCHTNTMNSSSPMQLRRRKSTGSKQNLQRGRSNGGGSSAERDQWVPRELSSEDLRQTWVEPGLFDEDKEEGEFFSQDPTVDYNPAVPEVCQSTDPRGHFSIFPNEVFCMILSHLSNSDLGVFSLTSRELNTVVRDYSCTRRGCRQILLSMPPMVDGAGHLLSASPSLGESDFRFPFEPQEENVVQVVEQFQDLGVLMRKLTMLLPPKSRVKVASFFFNKLDCTYQALVELLGHSAAYFSCGRLFFTFIRGWPNADKIKAYNMVQSLAKLEQRVKKVVLSSPSSLNLDERDVRWLHRHVFLDHALSEGEESYGFWLAHILKPWPITCQARLLYLLTAPHDSQGFISWTLACGCSNLQHLSGSVDFSELASSLKVLLQHCPRHWSMNDVISIIDELTTTPNGWCLENVAQLLVHCGAAITKGVLTSRATNGHMDELAVICFYLANTCCSQESHPSSDVNIGWFLDVVHSTVTVLPQTISKSAFLSSIVSKWQDYLTAIFEDSTPDDADSSQIQVDFINTLGNFTALTSLLLQLVLKIGSSD